MTYAARYDPDTQALSFVDESDPGPAGGYAVFVCGALQDPEKMAGLLGRRPPFSCGAVTGFYRGTEEIDGREIPFMVLDAEDPGRVLTGVLWLDLTDADLAAIESLELEGGYRERIKVEVVVGDETVVAASYTRK